MGGDHTIAFPLLRAVNKINKGPVALVHFDAHLDTWDTYFGAPYTHGTPFRRAREERLFLDDSSMHVGIRGPLYSRDDIKNDESFGFKIIHCDDFQSEGIDKIVDRIRNKGSVIIGGNIGKNKVTPNQKAKDDYLICFKALYDYVDYFAVNVSSPNTPNLRDLQNINDLREILHPLIELNKIRESKPILIKISPDLNDVDIKKIVDMALDLKIDGIITSNTTISRNNLKSKNKLINESGGLSGEPLKKRSTNIIKLIHEYSNKKLPIIGVGGIMSTEDALEKIEAGASLIQVYTGFIYNGPSFVRNINKEIIKSLN